jgi:hypothetical protein
MILVRFLDSKFLRGRAASLAETSNPPHERRAPPNRRIDVDWGETSSAAALIAERARSPA